MFIAHTRMTTCFFPTLGKTERKRSNGWKNGLDKDSMKADVLKFDPAAEVDTPERCFITELVNDESSPELSIARARVEPGVTTAWHKLIGTTERYLIVSGTGRMEVEGITAQDISESDVVLIPPGTPQRITNTGSEDLVFFAVCTPRFTPECYLGLE